MRIFNQMQEEHVKSQNCPSNAGITIIVNAHLKEDGMEISIVLGRPFNQMFCFAGKNVTFQKIVQRKKNVPDFFNKQLYYAGGNYSDIESIF
jgi:hypothetical protein